MSIMEEIAQPFARLVGQLGPIRQRVKAWTAFAMGADPEGAFIEGAAGLGKTAIMRADAPAALKATEIRGVFARPDYYASAGELRLDGEAWGKFMGRMMEAGTSFIYLDEMHELFRPSATVQTGKVVQLVKGLCDSTRGERRTVSFGDEGEVSRHASQVAFVIGTNFPKQLKDAEAIISRLGRITLDLYTEDELIAIAIILAKGTGLRVADDTLAMIARCGRGTARPIEKIIKALKQEALLQGKNSVNKMDVVNVMRDLGLYPRGLTKYEVFFLIQGEKGFMPKLTLATMLNIESKAVAESCAFLTAAGLVIAKGSAIATTQEGRNFLGALVRNKFALPA